MEDTRRTRQHLTDELAELRQRVAELEDSETARKQAEETLRFYWAILQNMPEGVQVTRTKDQVIVYANARFEEMFGYGHGELIGQHVSVLNAPGERSPQEVAEEIIRSLQENGVWYGEVHNIKKDRTPFWCFARVSTFEHPVHGTVWIAVHEDITERTVMEESLGHQQALFASRARIVERLLSTVELQPRLNTILGEAMRLAQTEMGAIYLVSGDEVLMRSWKGIPDGMRVAMQSFGISGVPRWLRAAVMLREAVDELDQMLPSAKEAGIQCLCSLPLAVEKRVSGAPEATWLGTLVLLSRNPQAAPERNLALLMQVSKELSLAVDHSLEYDRAIRRLVRLNILRQIDAGIMAHLGVDEILRIVVDNVPRELGADAVAVSMLPRKELRSQVFVMRLPNGTVVDEEVFSVADSMLHWLVERREPVIIYDLSTDPRVQMHGKLIRKHRLSSYLAVPLVVEDEALGVLSVLTTRPTVFRPEDVEFFQTLAGQAAIALKSAFLIEQVKQSEEKYRVLLETLEGGVATTDREGRLTYVSLRLLELTGYSREELLGQHFTRLEAPEYWEEAREDFQRDLESGLPHTVETEFVRKDGSRFPVELAMSNVIDGIGSVAGRIVVVRDITERKKVEEENEELRSRAYLASRLATVGEMAAGIAHEINNPLTSVIGFAELLMRQKLPEEVRRNLKIIDDNAKQVSAIVKGLLTFARQRRPERTLVSINELLEKTLGFRAYELTTGNIKVATEFDPELPLTVADAGQLQQVFLNLIVNAEQAMREAHGRGSLLIRTERLDTTIRVSFKDDGPGISNENMSKLFQPFFTTRKSKEGTGLGLSICYGIINEHKGMIYAQSEPGKGATFIVELPIVAHQEKAEVAEPGAGETEEVVGAKILVVDDEPTIGTLMERVLKDEGYEVRSVNSGEAALELIESESYDLILVDLKLPGMSGFELYDRLAQIDRSLTRKVAFITGDVMGTDTRNFLSSTKAPYFTKPFDLEEFKKGIARLLSGAEGILKG